MDVTSQSVPCRIFKGNPIKTLREIVTVGYYPAPLHAIMQGVLEGKGFFEDRIKSRDIAGALAVNPRGSTFEMKIIPYSENLLAFLESKRLPKTMPPSGGLRISKEEYSLFEGKAYPSDFFNKPFTEEEARTCSPWIDLIGNEEIHHRWVQEVYRIGFIKRGERGRKNMTLIAPLNLELPHIHPIVLRGLDTGSALSSLDGYTGKSGYFLGIRPA